MNVFEEAEYVLINWGQYDKLFLPVIEGKLLRSGLAVYKSTSIKGRIFYKLLESNIWCRVLDNFSFFKKEEPKRFYGFRWNEWINHALQGIGIERGWAAFSFPQNTDKRFVSLLINEEGETKGFAKVALDEESKYLFKNEANALKYLSTNKPVEFSIPKLVQEGEFDEGYYLIQTVIPPQTQYFSYVKDMRWMKIINEIVKINMAKKNLSHFSWWEKLRTTHKPVRNLLPFLENKFRENIDICNVHGDFGSGNIRYDTETLWVYDWEEFNQEAPIMTDYLTFILDCFMKSRFVTNREIAKRTYDYLQENVEYADSYNLAIALAYMSTRRSWTIGEGLCNALCKELLGR